MKICIFITSLTNPTKHGQHPPSSSNLPYRPRSKDSTDSCVIASWYLKRYQITPRSSFFSILMEAYIFLSFVLLALRCVARSRVTFSMNFTSSYHSTKDPSRLTCPRIITPSPSALSSPVHPPSAYQPCPPFLATGSVSSTWPALHFIGSFSSSIHGFRESFQLAHEVEAEGSPSPSRIDNGFPDRGGDGGGVVIERSKVLNSAEWHIKGS